MHCAEEKKNLIGSFKDKAIFHIILEGLRVLSGGEVFNKKINKKSWAHKPPPPIITKVNPSTAACDKVRKTSSYLHCFL